MEERDRESKRAWKQEGKSPSTCIYWSSLANIICQLHTNHIWRKQRFVHLKHDFRLTDTNKEECDAWHGIWISNMNIFHFIGQFCTDLIFVTVLRELSHFHVLKRFSYNFISLPRILGPTKNTTKCHVLRGVKNNFPFGFIQRWSFKLKLFESKIAYVCKKLMAPLGEIGHWMVRKQFTIN